MMRRASSFGGLRRRPPACSPGCLAAGGSPALRRHVAHDRTAGIPAAAGARSRGFASDTDEADEAVSVSLIRRSARAGRARMPGGSACSYHGAAAPQHASHEDPQQQHAATAAAAA